MAVSKKITKKVIASGGKAPAKVEEQEEAPQISEKTPLGDKPTFDKKRVCFFCQNQKEPSYTDLATLKRYINERAKIVPRMKTGVCAKHQRSITKGVKYARHLALLPFTPRV